MIYKPVHSPHTLHWIMKHENWKMSWLHRLCEKLTANPALNSSSHLKWKILLLPVFFFLRGAGSFIWLWWQNLFSRFAQLLGCFEPVLTVMLLLALKAEKCFALSHGWVQHLNKAQISQCAGGSSDSAPLWHHPESCTKWSISGFTIRLLVIPFTLGNYQTRSFAHLEAKYILLPSVIHSAAQETRIRSFFLTWSF